MSTPIRIQRKRTKGWKMPENTVYVGRPTKFGNPLKVSPLTGMTAEKAVALYKQYADRGAEVIRRELRGKNLACWCRLDRPCHADVLLKIANAPESFVALQEKCRTFRDQLHAAAGGVS